MTSQKNWDAMVSDFHARADRLIRFFDAAQKLHERWEREDKAEAEKARKQKRWCRLVQGDYRKLSESRREWIRTHTKPGDRRNWDIEEMLKEQEEQGAEEFSIDNELDRRMGK